MTVTVVLYDRTRSSQRLFFTVSVTEYITKEANDSLISFHTLLCHVLPFTSFQTQQDTSAPSEGGQQRKKAITWRESIININQCLQDPFFFYPIYNSLNQAESVNHITLEGKSVNF